MGFLTGDQAVAEKLTQTIRDVERLKTIIASLRGQTGGPTSSVWVKASGSPVSGVWDGVFQEWEGFAFIDTVDVCKVRSSTPGGVLPTGIALLGRIVDVVNDVPVVAVAYCCPVDETSGSGGGGSDPLLTVTFPVVTAVSCDDGGLHVTTKVVHLTGRSLSVFLSNP